MSLSVNILDKVNEIQALIDRAKEQRIRAEAARDEALKRLQEMGFEGVDDALDALETMADETDQLEAKLADEIAKIEKQYPQLMGE